MASTFNAFGGRSINFGGHTPIWLGVVSPRAKGGVLASAYAKAGNLIPAGTPVKLEAGVITPLVGWVVVSVETSTHAITVTPSVKGIVPAVNDVVTPVGATFTTTGAAGKVASVAKGANEGQFVITMTTSALDASQAGVLLAPSSNSAAAASGASLAVVPNGYLYNDILIDAEEEASATGAVVDFHGEGILIDRTPAAKVAAQMKAVVPNVIQVND